VRAWMAQPATGALTVEAREDGSLFLEDTRQTTTARPRTAVLRGGKAAGFLACDRTQTFPALADLPSVRRAGISHDELAGFLGRCAANRLVLHGERSWLNVAVHTPARDEPERGADVLRRVGATASVAG